MHAAASAAVCMEKRERSESVQVVTGDIGNYGDKIYGWSKVIYYFRRRTDCG